ncbi:MAG: hypothetical protein COV00_03510 [Candidatus Tagabacteria bacterium CG10_big_fil_rev_8_21_14_0_10_40_13]|uniref:Uncharacterized protein n=1 Tax=Candidatus Tagabacteria bacterium CG10_big_fil_rev_8_21_14_0_10_40_13 TaxID=1975022 RepID=A0A2M8L817_9BACT|nr:MAG: hypothetical protein COV00_03510 [Candidatus Tagabacteria bacterium CG10_big_fil_rev_8_21_14_0_10_40_13]
MEKSLLKKFEKTYLELQIVFAKAKSWDINEEQRKQIEEWIKSTTESYQKVKEKYEKLLSER